MKRNDYINWDEYFMGVALLASKRSKDPNTQVGACIVDSTCIATSLLIPKSEHAIGMRRSEPPATPDAPQAPRVATIQRSNAEGKSTETPIVLAAAKVIMAMVIAAPSILMLAPRGIETE